MKELEEFQGKSVDAVKALKSLRDFKYFLNFEF